MAGSANSPIGGEVFILLPSLLEKHLIFWWILHNYRQVFLYLSQAMLGLGNFPLSCHKGFCRILVGCSHSL